MSSSRPSVGYGTINVDLVRGWLGLAPEDDPPFWAVNLMKYREVATYADGREGVSGRDADDAYAPLGPLAAIGAAVALHGDVVAQPSAGLRWDRVGIVRYPSRAGFFAMQQRDDFKAQHEHKEAGMEFTIVMASAPSGDPVATPPGADLMVRVRRLATDADAAAADAPVDGATPVARLAVEGVIVGDERRWDEIAFDAVAPGDTATIEALCAPHPVVDELIAVVVRPEIDALADTIREHRS